MATETDRDWSPVETAYRASLAAHPTGATFRKPDDEDDFDDVDFAEPGHQLRFVFFTAVPAWLISMVVHMIALFVLAMIMVGPDAVKVAMVLRVVDAREDSAEVAEFDLREQIAPLDVTNLPTSAPTMQPLTAEVPEQVTEDITAATDLDAAPLSIELSEFGEQTAPKSDLLKSLGALAGSGLEGRGSANRARMVKAAGGTDASEKAVALALQWFAAHQLPDGGWSFDHRGGACQGRCGNPGTMADCRTGATAMALLPFLGAGQTHREGQYKDNVRAGLAFLARSMKANGSLVQGGGNLYAHGLGAIVLCEAYAMTDDRQLIAPAQAAINFIVFAQDPIGGGWRYVPRQPGDTSVVGWQLMALKSGHMAYLNVPPKTVLGAMRFLDSVQANGGANYGYTGPGQGDATSAVGLLCRMYLGWKKDHPGLEHGVKLLSKKGPNPANMYYNYYATQVLRHWEGDEWKRWNEVMREMLVTSQSHDGHMQGSWMMEGRDHGFSRGGRLYCTSMATMILEVYYRHMPIYAKSASEEEFPLN